MLQQDAEGGEKLCVVQCHTPIFPRPDTEVVRPTTVAEYEHELAGTRFAGANQEEAVPVVGLFERLLRSLFRRIIKKPRCLRIWSVEGNGRRHRSLWR